MRNAGGYVTLSIEGKVVTEFDSFTCSHCQFVQHVRPKEDPTNLGGLCKQCMKLICKKCLGRGCLTWEKNMDIMERRDRLYRALHGDYR